MAKATKATEATKQELAYAKEVKDLFDAEMHVLDLKFPKTKDGSMSYKRSAYARNMLWMAQRDLNVEGKPAKNGEVYGSAPQLERAKRDYEDAIYLADRRAQEADYTDENNVYDTKVERTREWLERMTMQHHGDKKSVDAWQIIVEYLSDKE